MKKWRLPSLVRVIIAVDMLLNMFSVVFYLQYGDLVIKQQLGLTAEQSCVGKECKLLYHYSRGTAVWLAVHVVLLYFGLRTSLQEIRRIVCVVSLFLYCGAFLQSVRSSQDNLLESSNLYPDLIQYTIFGLLYGFVFFFKKY
eukprot:TRINITY_DN23558_c0_g1_i1.p1 TRINITY_DN23558_c0_g1~~TRINITY_DN23558_c0_g1_i1.p1  ORF type:complete len:142 (+),score=21.48 TRINITY_DN23558_c0_g1_i1:56-481(+)